MFILALDKTLRKVVEVFIGEHRIINKPIINQNRIAPIPVGGFADDVYLAYLYEHVFQAMVIAFKEGIISTNLMLRSDKCGLFYERRRANRWYKAKRDVQPSVSFNGKEVKVHERHEPCTYLGKPLTVAGEDENHVEEIFDKYVELLDNIATSVAPIPVKLEALEIMALAKIAHQFANTRISEEKVSEFDKVLIKCLRRISECCFGIGDTITIRACYQPKVKGGFGVRLPSIVYHASRIAHLISMLNHEEENIRFVARNSLELDMHKRNISRVHHGRNCLGFEIKNDGKFSTKVKGGFGAASDWPHLNLLACKVGIELIWEKPNAKDLIEAGSLMIVINGELFEYHTKRQLHIKMQSLQLDKEMNALTELKMQGTLVNLPFLDYLLSQI